MYDVQYVQNYFESPNSDFDQLQTASFLITINVAWEKYALNIDLNMN